MESDVKSVLLTGKGLSLCYNEIFYEYPVMLCGASQTGKTTFLSQLTGKKIMTSPKPTLAVQYTTKAILKDGIRISGEKKFLTYLFSSFAVQFCDTPGFNEFNESVALYRSALDSSHFFLMSSLVRGSSAFFLLYDIANYQSFEKAAIWLRGLKQIIQPGAIIMLIGNKVLSVLPFSYDPHDLIIATERSREPPNRVDSRGS
jgi:small GTP-binding protein